jgi:site-specific recombinase XerD
VEAWIADLAAAGRARATIRSRWIALRSLYRWAAVEGEVAENPVARVVVTKANEPPPDVIDDDDLRRLLKACAGIGFYERRDLALIRLMVATGLRVSELCSLTVGGVDLRNRVAVVAGKGGRPRAVRFDPATAAALDRYIRARARHRHAANPALFVGYRGPITRKGVPAILNHRAVAAGIGHVHPHQFRHTWASRWLDAGGQEGDLQRLGGWESAEIMRRYGSARAADRALAAYDTVNPMEGL